MPDDGAMAYDDHRPHEVPRASRVWDGHGTWDDSGLPDDATGSGPGGPSGPKAGPPGEVPPDHVGHGVPAGPPDSRQVTLRTPAELADALPYLLGYRPEDSIVLVALQDGEKQGRFGGRARLGIPPHTDDWAGAARQLTHGLVKGSERRGARPESMVAYLCQEPASGETGRDVMERLRPLAQLLRTTCGSLDVPVVEALCISDGRFWSYCCPSAACCPPEGTPMGLPGTSVLAAAAAYAGISVRGSLKEVRARLMPWETSAALDQEAALETASTTIVPRMLDDEGREQVAEETIGLAGRLLERFAHTRTAPGTLAADLRDDELLGHDEAAALILGLQDRWTRDRAAQWMEGDEAAWALRLWRALSRRCVGPYREHAAAPLTLAGWVAWSSGDELEARESLAMALAADPDYLFARLLHQACNEGLDPEAVRRCLRAERTARTVPDTADVPDAWDLPDAPDEPDAPGAADALDASDGETVTADPSGPLEPTTGADHPLPALPRRIRRPRPTNTTTRPNRRTPKPADIRHRGPADTTAPPADAGRGKTEGPRGRTGESRRKAEGPRGRSGGSAESRGRSGGSRRIAGTAGRDGTSQAPEAGT